MQVVELDGIRSHPDQPSPRSRSPSPFLASSYLRELEASPVQVSASEHHRLHEARVLAAELAERGGVLSQVELSDLLQHHRLLVRRPHRRHEALRLNCFLFPATNYICAR